MASPIYEQIAGTLRQRISSGKYAVGEQIPPLEKLTDEFGASRMTVIKAIDNLEAVGLVLRQQGRGTFVTSVPNTIHAITDLASDEIKLDGGERSSKLTACHLWQDKLPELEQRYEAPRAYQYLSRTMYAQGRPYHDIEYFVDLDVFKSRDEVYWHRTTLRQSIMGMEEFAPANIRQILKVGAADIEQAKNLQLDLNAPVLHARRIFTAANSNRVLCLALLTFRADLVRFDTTIECSTDENFDNIRGHVLHELPERKS